MQFNSLGLNDLILKAVQDLGFQTPTPIQEKIIPLILEENRDLVGLAQTGTGKTAAFGLPLIEKLDFSEKFVQGLILSPTRELCMQITGDLTNFTKYIPKATVTPVYGGASIENQIRQIKSGSQIVVATPGRLVDLIKRKVISLSKVRFVVLDEADEMLNMGFKDDLDFILDKTPAIKNTWLFSATMPREVTAIAGKYMQNPLEVTVGNRNSGAGNIEHFFYKVSEKNRFDALRRLLDYYPDIYGLIFCRTRRDTQAVAEKLLKSGYSAEALHGDLSQSQRDSVMRKFREQSLQILVATDVAARGIDVDSISHVINYNLPDEAEQYVHRSGRTGRAGKKGISLSIINGREQGKIKQIEKTANIRINHDTIPSGYAVCEKQLFSMIQQMMSANVDEKAIESYMPAVYDTLASLTREELIKRLVASQFNHFLDFYKNAPDLNDTFKGRQDAGANGKGRNQERGRTGSKGPANTVRFFINFGVKDRITKSTIVRLVCDEAHISNRELGTIDIKREFSFFEVEEGQAGNVYSSLQQAKLDGRKVVVEPAEKNDDTGDRKRKKKKRKQVKNFA